MLKKENIHPTAIIHPKAKLHGTVTIGPYSFIDENVSIGEGTVIGNHVNITGNTKIGLNNKIFHSSSLGAAPQDMKYANEPTSLIIGDNNTIREFCTFNTGTIQDQGVTKVGNSNWFMAYVHIAHDCVVGNNNIFANNAGLAGHVIIHDFIMLGAFTAVHQFCMIGSHAITMGGTLLSQDIPPFVRAVHRGGATVKPNGINSEGLKRRGFSPETISTIKKAYKFIYRDNNTIEEAKIELSHLTKETPEINLFIELINRSSRGLIR
tara:strand:+ start:1170 stop:1964 length:795 start_codon:yes stop_codon:yes gene_type:complete